jgi:hypothetical protein
MYNDVLKLRIPDQAKIIGYADYIAIVVVAKYIEEIEVVSNEAISRVREWLETVGLELAAHKTEAVLVSNRKKKESVTVKVGKHTIKSSEAIKYLGIMIDNRLNFRNHIDHVCKKAAKASIALSSMLPNIGGLKEY